MCEQTCTVVQAVPEMGDDFPGGVPLLSLLSIPVAPVAEESAHLAGASEAETAAYPLEVGLLRCSCRTGAHRWLRQGGAIQLGKSVRHEHGPSVRS